MRMDISQLPEVSLSQTIAESEHAFSSNFYGDPTFIVHNGKIYAETLLGGPEELRVYDLKGSPQASPKMDVSGIGQILPWGDGVLVRQYSYLAPNSWLQFDGIHTSIHTCRKSFN